MRPRDGYCVLCGGPTSCNNLFTDTYNDEEFEDYVWDPKILPKQKTQWLERYRIIGDASGTGDQNNDLPVVAFISRRGQYSNGYFYSGYGEDENEDEDVESTVREQKYDDQGFEDPDPNDPNVGYVDINYNSYLCRPSAYLFHESCWVLLARMLGYPNHTLIDKPAMYSAIKTLSFRRHCQFCDINLDYGPLEHHHYWVSEPGHEYIGCEPKLDVPVQIPTLPKRPSKLTLDLNSKVIRDPFSMLPYDILFAIMSYLPSKSRFQLMLASHRTYTMMQKEDSFWKLMIQRDIACWCPEIRPLIAELSSPAINVKSVYFQLRHDFIHHTVGNTGPFMGLANRTRIMNACLPLAKVYFESLGESSTNIGFFYESIESPYPNQREKEASRIRDNAFCDDLPLLRYPLQPHGLRNETVQFLDILQDIEDSRRFCASFNPEGAIVGITVEFVTHRKTLGIFDEQSTWIDLQRHELMRGFYLYMREPEFTDGSLEKAYTYVEGIAVDFGDGRTFPWGVCKQNSGVRCLYPVHENVIVGLTGSISTDGAICHLGLLQYNPKRKPSQSILPKSLLPLIWNQSLIGTFGPMRFYIWELSNINMLPFPEHDKSANNKEISKSLSIPAQNQFPRCLLQHHPLIWSRTRGEHAGLVSIRVILSASTRRQHILGLNVTNNENINRMRFRDDRWRSVGYPPSDSELLPDRYKGIEVRTEEFAIAGDREELIEEIHFCRHTGALKLVTNHGRSCTWGGDPDMGEHRGSSGGEGWTVQKGEFVGLVCVFGNSISETSAAASLSDVTALEWVGGWREGW